MIEINPVYQIEEQSVDLKPVFSKLDKFNLSCLVSYTTSANKFKNKLLTR